MSGNYVTGFLWVRAVTIAMQQLSKQTLNNGTTLFRGVRAEEISWRPAAIQSQFVRSSPTSEVSIGDRHGKCVIIWDSNW
jgi:hypothetical protein